MKKVKNSTTYQQIFNFNLICNFLIGVAICLAITGLAVCSYERNTNQLIDMRAARLVYLANHRTNPAKPKAISSSAAVVPSTIKPAVSMIADYQVAPTLPRYLIIPKLGVNARILSVGLDAAGNLETPDNVFDTAWYDQSALPGASGAMLIDGHISSWTTEGVFYGLDRLVAGDTITVERGDGTNFNYQVVQTQVYPASDVDMTAATNPIEPGTPGLNLISCSGDVIPGTSEFNERIVVFASLE